MTVRARVGEFSGGRAVRLVAIGKRYSGTKALDNVSVEVAGGTVHGLVGANGAGKSTLGKIIGGVIRPDDGQLFVDDRQVRYTSPREARIDGIATISQELSPMPHMSVIENVYFGIEPRRFGLVQWRQMRRQYEELVSLWGFELDGNAKVGMLRTADKQKTEILRAVAADARVIVMDEPTSSLTSVETKTLHRMIRTLREGGRTIVYVSHFLDEVLELADTVTVLRSGHLVRTAPVAEETEESLVAGMFGAAAEAEHFEKPRNLTTPVVLDVSGLHRKGVLRDISLQIRAGEIVGLAGLVGSGRSELARAISGADPIDGGTIAVDGTARAIRSPADAMAAGMAFVPESRKDDGLFLELSAGGEYDIRGPPLGRLALGDTAPRPRAGEDELAAETAVCRAAGPVDEDGEPLRRQPAEAPVRPLDAPQPAGADPRRAHARRRRRGAGGDPPPDQQAGGGGQRRPADLVGDRGGARARPSRARDAPRLDHS